MYSLGDRARYVNKSRIERIRCLEGLALARLFRGDRGQQQLLQRFLVSGKVQTRHSCREPPFILRADFQRFLAAIVSQCAPQNLYSLPRHKRPILSDVHIHLNGTTYNGLYRSNRSHQFGLFALLHLFHHGTRRRILFEQASAARHGHSHTPMGARCSKATQCTASVDTFPIN